MITTLAIGGMSCGHCVAAVQKALQDLEGVDVRQVAVGQATVDLGEGRSANDVIEAVRDAGYDARVVDARTG